MNDLDEVAASRSVTGGLPFGSGDWSGIDFLEALVRENTNQRFRSDMDNGQYSPHEPRGNGPPGTREEADTEPNADQVGVDGGGHIGFSRW